MSSNAYNQIGKYCSLNWVSKSDVISNTPNTVSLAQNGLSPGLILGILHDFCFVPYLSCCSSLWPLVPLSPSKSV